MRELKSPNARVLVRRLSELELERENESGVSISPMSMKLLGKDEVRKVLRLRLRRGLLIARRELVRVLECVRSSGRCEAKMGGESEEMDMVYASGSMSSFSFSISISSIDSTSSSSSSVAEMRGMNEVSCTPVLYRRFVLILGSWLRWSREGGRRGTGGRSRPSRRASASERLVRRYPVETVRSESRSVEERGGAECVMPASRERCERERARVGVYAGAAVLDAVGRTGEAGGEGEGRCRRE